MATSARQSTTTGPLHPGISMVATRVLDGIERVERPASGERREGCPSASRSGRDWRAGGGRLAPGPPAAEQGDDGKGHGEGDGYGKGALEPPGEVGAAAVDTPAAQCEVVDAEAQRHPGRVEQEQRQCE